MFTSIPLNEIYHSITTNWEKILPITNIKCKTTFLNLIKFICNNNYFTANMQLYRQTTGTPMGSRISTSLCGIVINSILDKIIPKYKDDIKLIGKYVDDIIIIMNKNKFNNLFDELNQYNNNIKFTYEEEINSEINYLDLTLIRNTTNGSINTKWYEKEIKKGKILNYLSMHPLKQKINTIENIMFKIIKLTDIKYLQEKKKYIINNLELNSYPTKTIKKAWIKMQNKINSLTQNKNNIENTTDNNNKRYASITYIKDISHKIVKILKQKEEKPTLYSFKPNNKIKSNYHTKLKDNRDKLEKTDVIYKINCANCPGTYIGETKQKLKNRISQHQYDINNNKESTALATHVKNSKHKVNLENVEILETESNTNRRKMLEAIHISKNKNSINYKEDAKEINKFYNNILKEI